MTIRKAVIPAAGYGTRFLPATKAVPKELLPIVDKPTIQYIVEECARAGLDDVLLITAAGKGAIEDHFDRAPELEAALEAKGKEDLLAEVRRASSIAQVHAVRQDGALGLGHAVLQAKNHVGDQPFVVVLGDDIVDPDEPYLEKLIATYETTGRAVVALMEVADSEVDKYGIAAVEPTDGLSGARRGLPDDGVFTITALVEKPPVGQAPSNLAIIGRYVLPPAIFDVLENQTPGAGGEIQLTDALQTLAAEAPLVGVRLDGVRHDAGDKLGFLQASVDFACRRDDIGPAFFDWLEEFVADRRSTGEVLA